MDYSRLGLDKKMRALTALSNRHKRVDSLEMEAYYDVKTSFIDASKADLGEFIKQSNGATGTADFSASQALNLTSTITYNSPHIDRRTFGKPMVALYQGDGTASANQIYPIRGASVTLGRYDVIGGELDYATYNGTSDHWKGMIVDTNGTSTQVVTFAANWIFTDYVSNEVG